MEMKQMADQRRGASEGSPMDYKFRDMCGSEEAKGGTLESPLSRID